MGFFDVRQLLVSKSQVACLHELRGRLQVGNALEQLQVPLLKHLPVLHSLPLVHAEPPLSNAAAASSLARVLSIPPRLKPPRKRVRLRRVCPVPSVFVRASKREPSMIASDAGSCGC